MTKSATAYHSINPDEFHTHQKLLKLITRGESVLEVGCATGYMSQALLDKGCTIEAIEIDPFLASQAHKKGIRVYTGDATYVLKKMEKGKKYDVILFADVLEHMADPHACLAQSLNHLKKNGRIIVSLPNIANIAVRLNLLSGNFDYQEWGIMDKTHLKFFTRDSFNRLVSSLSLKIKYFDAVAGLDQLLLYRITLAPIVFRVKLLRQLEYQITKKFPTLLALQFIYVLKK